MKYHNISFGNYMHRSSRVQSLVYCGYYQIVMKFISQSLFYIYPMICGWIYQFTLSLRGHIRTMHQCSNHGDCSTVMAHLYTLCLDVFSYILRLVPTGIFNASGKGPPEAIRDIHDLTFYFSLLVRCFPWCTSTMEYKNHFWLNYKKLEK